MPHLSRGIPRCARLPAVLFVLAPLAAEAQDGLGKQVFMTVSQPPCALCHILADAGSAGEIGPNLDELKPTGERVLAAVRDGVGVMPAYKEKLSEEQIAAVAEYVAAAIGKAE